MNSKRAVSGLSMLIILILAIFLLVTLFFIYQDSFNADLYKDVVSCKATFSSLNLLSRVDFSSSNIQNLIQDSCPPNDLTLRSEENFNQVKDFVNSCWQKVNNGNIKVLNDLDQNIGICIHCGTLRSEDEIEFSDNFMSISEDIKNSLGQTNEGISLNNEFLFNPDFLPQTISQRPVDLFFYAYKEDLRCFNEGIQGVDCIRATYNHLLRTLTNNAGLAGAIANRIAARSTYVTGMFFIDIENSDVGEGRLEISGVEAGHIQCNNLIFRQAQRNS